MALVSGADLDGRSHRYPPEEIDYVIVTQADAPVTGGGADQILPVGSVEIDVTIARADILRIEPFEPEDARQDQILLSAWSADCARRDAVLENAPRRGSLADFFADPEAARRGAQASLLRAKAELRGGDIPGCRDGPVLEKIRDLTGDVDHQELVFGKTHGAGCAGSLQGRGFKGNDYGLP